MASKSRAAVEPSIDPPLMKICRDRRSPKGSSTSDAARKAADTCIRGPNLASRCSEASPAASDTEMIGGCRHSVLTRRSRSTRTSSSVRQRGTRNHTMLTPGRCNACRRSVSRWTPKASERAAAALKSSDPTAASCRFDAISASRSSVCCDPCAHAMTCSRPGMPAV